MCIKISKNPLILLENIMDTDNNDFSYDTDQ